MYSKNTAAVKTKVKIFSPVPMPFYGFGLGFRVSRSGLGMDSRYYSGFLFRDWLIRSGTRRGAQRSGAYSMIRV